MTIAVDQVFAGARVVAIARAPGRLRITMTTGADVALDFDLAAAVSRPGPFAALPALGYRSSSLPFAAIEPIGRALAAALAPVWPGIVAARWTDALDALGDDVDATLALGPWLADEPRGRWPCVAPWTRLEYGRDRQYGPCCADFQTAPARGDGGPLALWRSTALRRFRQALAGASAPATCRATCPRLGAGSDTVSDLILRGGPPAFRANQRAVVESILAGADDPATTPLELVCSTTSYCNYDCLMCSHGETGTLADELPLGFYQALAPILPGLSRLEVLGGEPLASPVFREVLGGALFAEAPQLELALTTNGSYLTADALARWRHVRFAHVTVSLNAAGPPTYEQVTRGLAWPRIRANLDALLAARARWGNPIAITYSMVILRANHHELAAFAALAEADDVAVRFMLPMGDRNGQSIMTDTGAMTATHDALGAVATRLRARDRAREAARIDGERAVLAARLARGVLRVLPD